MQKINNIQVITIFLILVSTFSACKKGENDPFFSLKSRKARLVGEWKIAEGNIEESGNYSYGEQAFNWQATYKYTANELNLSGIDNQVYNNIPSVDTIQDIYSYSEKITFNKDYTFKIEINTSLKSVGGVAVTQPLTSVYKYEGNWNFGAKNKEKDLKNKEYLVLHITNSNTTETQGEETGSYNSTYSGFAYSEEYFNVGSPVLYLVLDKLTNKEIVVKFEESGTTNEVDGVASRTEFATLKGTKTYKKD